MGKSPTSFWIPLSLAFLAASCAKPEMPSHSCAPRTLPLSGGNTGTAAAFLPDPVIASGNPALSPTYLGMDGFRSAVSLLNLGGRGVLEGRYLEVRDGIHCDEWFGAYETEGQFYYSHSDSRFQEAMAYYIGNEYRSTLDLLGYLWPTQPVRVIAHCVRQDNAYFAREKDSSGQILPKVCLGDSLATPGASYGDDGAVTIHELQHATTTELYASGGAGSGPGGFWYDEAGALNEGISDFVALMSAAEHIPPSFDPRQFSRWALDRFIPGQSAARGAHRCPEYDSGFRSGCQLFGSFSSDANTISFIYPDGMGWPYADNYSGPDQVRSAFLNYHAQEEIHTNGVLIAGALWDAYEALISARQGDAKEAKGAILKALFEAIRHLPQPSSKNLAPVTYRSFAATLLDVAPSVGFGSSELDAVSGALAARGLVGGRVIEAGWAQRGEGEPATPGLKIEDNPSRLKSWLYAMGSNASQVRQGLETGLNSQLDPGEVAAVWFDLQNISEVTAGGVLLSVTSLDSDITFLDGATNLGAISDRQAQIMYSKINGTGIVQAMSGPKFPLSIGNSYFQTHPHFSQNWNTALWVKVSASAPHGKWTAFQVEAIPSNGEVTRVEFPVLVR